LTCFVSDEVVVYELLFRPYSARAVGLPDFDAGEVVLTPSYRCFMGHVAAETLSLSLVQPI